MTPSGWGGCTVEKGMLVARGPHLRFDLTVNHVPVTNGLIVLCHIVAASKAGGGQL